MKAKQANKKHAARAALAVEVYRREVGDYRGDDETLLVDFLADLMHWSQAHGLLWGDACDHAERHYLAERRQADAGEEEHG